MKSRSGLMPLHDVVLSWNELIIGYKTKTARKNRAGVRNTAAEIWVERRLLLARVLRLLKQKSLLLLEKGAGAKPWIYISPFIYVCLLIA